MPGLISLRAPAFWWKKPGLAATLLAPLGAVYGGFAAQRMKRPGYRANIPVICIGNPTLGGAGKTPAAIAVAKLLQERGRKPFFISRGYGGNAAGPLRVDPEKHTAGDTGDEALLLAATAPTIIGADRAASAKLAESLGADVLVMDDGFQNPSLEKDLSILVVDGERGIGNEKVFPAGPLRAPLPIQLAQAHVMVAAGAGTGGQRALSAAILANLAVLSAVIAPGEAAVAALRGKPLLAFAGIGFPEKFFATLERNDLRVAERRAFPDHHRFSAADAAALIAAAERGGLTLVTTEKDFARMGGDPALRELREKSKTLPVALAFDDTAEIGGFIDEALARKR